MKKRIEQLLNGKYEYAIPKLILSQETITITAKAGENCQGEIYVGTDCDSNIKGFVCSSHRRFIPGVEKFQGVHVTIPYGIDVAGMEPGEECSGTVTLTTNVGEYQVPFFVTVAKNEVKTAAGKIQSMEDFTKLVQEDFREAFHVFTDPAFSQVLEGEPQERRTLYRAMSQNPVTYQHLEEFMIGCKVKEAVHIALGEVTRDFYEVKETIQESVLLKKNGWGHLRIDIETRGDFIQVDKRVIHEEDFIGSSYEAEYRILEHKLGHGKHYGQILFKTPYETIVYQIQATRNQELAIDMNLAEKKNFLYLQRDYLSLRLGQLDYPTWIAHSKGVYKKLQDEGCDYPIYQLYYAYVLHMNEEDDSAREILQKYSNKSFSRDDIELAGAYLYLCVLTGLADPVKIKLSDKLAAFYRQRPDSFQLLWIRMQCDEELIQTPSLTLHLMEEIYDRGCRSPFLYLEVFRLIKKDLTLLRNVSGIYTQMFLFAGKHKMLNEELALRLSYLSGYEKHFSWSLFEALTEAYEAFPTQDTLTAICKYIMKGNPENKIFFPWFERAVEQGLRLTRLYEYYIETMNQDTQKTLPMYLRKYFAFNNTLSDRKKAYIYANAVINRRSDEQTYLSYRDKMEEFSREKLKSGKVNRDYAIIYQQFADTLTEHEQGEALAKVMFTRRLYCDDKKVRSIIVVHPALKEESIYPCVEGVAYPRIYTEDAQILFQDEQKRRYAGTVDYNLRKLFDEKELISICRDLSVTNPGFLLHVCDQGQYGKNISPENVFFYQSLTESENFTDSFRTRIRRQLLNYYQNNKDVDELDEYLRKSNYFELARINKKVLIELMIERGLFEEAYMVVCEYGYEHVEPEALLKLCSRMILKHEFEKDEEILDMANCVYCSGKYDEVILCYLVKWTWDSVEQMIMIWKSARNFQMDTYDLEEKILQLLMFLRDYRIQGSSVFENYVKNRGKERVIRAYLNHVAYGNFIKKQEITAYELNCLSYAYDREWPMPMAGKLALLSGYSRRQDWDSREAQQVKALLAECQKNHLAFAFFRKLPEELLAPYQLDDKMYVEYRSNPKSKVTLYYAADNGLGEKLVYKSEPLRNIYEGVFVKTFTLFYGENLHYYFVITDGEHTETTQEHILHMTKVDYDKSNKYQLINQMLAERKLGKEKEAEEKLTQYMKQENYVMQLYHIEKEETYE